MTIKMLLQQRLLSQHLAGERLDTPSAIVSWMGAIQAQDYAGAKWATGLRMAQPDPAAVESAINDGHILRTHVLRPT